MENKYFNRKTLEKIYYVAFFLMVLTFGLRYVAYSSNIEKYFVAARWAASIVSFGLFCLLFLNELMCLRKSFDRKEFLIFITVLLSVVLALIKMPLSYSMIIPATYFYKLSSFEKLIKTTSLCMVFWFFIWFIPFATNNVVTKFFGFTYKNHASLITWFAGIVIGFLFIEKNKVISILSVVVSSIIGILIFNSRTPFYATVIFVFVFVFTFLMNKYELFSRHKHFDCCFETIFKLLPVIMFLATLIVSFITRNKTLIDGAFSCRFIELFTYLHSFKIKLFGNEIVYNQTHNGLFIFGDNLHYRYLFEFGIIISLYAVVYSYLINKKLYSTRDGFVIAIIFAINVYTVMETANLVFVFLPICLSYIDRKTTKGKDESNCVFQC